MFENPGRKIKTVATVNFVLDVILSVIVAIILANIGGDDIEILFPLLVAIGIAIGYVLSLLIYGFGELIVLTDTIACRVKDINNQQSTNNSGVSSDQSTNLFRQDSDRSSHTQAADSTGNDDAVSRLLKSKSTVATKPMPCLTPDGEWTCRSCGRKNMAGANYCKGCYSQRS